MRGISRTITPALAEPRDDGRRLLLDAGRNETIVERRLGRHHLDARRRGAHGSARAPAAACSNAHAGGRSSAVEQARERARRPSSRARTARRRRRGVERAVRLVARLREVARRRDTEPLRVAHDERSGGVRAAEPLLPGDREEVDPVDVVGIAPTDCAPSASTGTPLALAQLGQREDGAGRPQHLRDRDQPRPRRDRGEDRVRVGLDDDDPRRRGAERAEQPEVLVGRRHDLVVGPEAEAAEHDRAAVGRRVRSGRPGRLGRRPGRRTRGARLAERHASPRSTRSAARPARDRRRPRRRRVRRRRASGPNVPAFRYATARGRGMPRADRRATPPISTRASTTGWSESTTPFCIAPLPRPRDDRVDAGAAHEHVVDPAPRREYASRPGSATLKSPASTTTSPGVAHALGERGGACRPRRRHVGMREVIGAWIRDVTPRSRRSGRVDEPPLAPGPATCDRARGRSRQ